ncbi:MAG: HAMP domain-containing histidine kinase [Firmicutes bacterium]|nr:HAMP domain-containing histidine kinase [Bacillota bacterium]
MEARVRQCRPGSSPADAYQEGGACRVLLVAMLFLVFALLIVARVPRGSQAVWLGLILFAFGCCILGQVGLISRFGNYQLDSLMVVPFDRPAFMLHLLSRMPLYAFMRFRLWSLVGFVTAMNVFAVTYTGTKSDKRDVAVLGVTAATAFLLVWYYDPEHLFSLYVSGAQLAFGQEARRQFEQGIHIVDLISTSLVIGNLAFAVWRVFSLWAKSSIVQKRAQALSVGMSCGILSILFVGLTCTGSTATLNGHAMATTLLPIAHYPVIDTTYIHLIPYATPIAIGAMATSILRYGFLGTWRIGSGELNRQIHVANQAVRIALHSFKNRFLAVQMATDMAEKQLQDIDDERAAEALTKIQWAKDVCCEALGMLDILHYQSTHLKVEPDHVQMRDLWLEAQRRCAHRLSGIDLTIDGLSKNVPVFGDREHLANVVENILENAIDAVSAPRHQPSLPQIRVEVGSEYEWCFIRIADNGPGIPRHQVGKVFNPFFTTKPTGASWGMGLAYCHRVVTAHRGFINLKTLPGSGSTFEVVLRCPGNLDRNLSSSPSLTQNVEAISS